MQHHKMEYRSKGHTLLELCIVILLLMACSYGVMLCLGYSARYQLRAELDRLATVLVYLQRKALITRTPSKIQFVQKSYTANKTWQLTSGEFGVLPGIKGPPSKPTKAPQVVTELLITEDGIVGAGTLYLTDGTYQYALSSDASEISCLRKYRYDEGWRLLN